MIAWNQLHTCYQTQIVCLDITREMSSALIDEIRNANMITPSCDNLGSICYKKKKSL